MMYTKTDTNNYHIIFDMTNLNILDIRKML